MIPKFNDALELIQRAEEKMLSEKNEAYNELLKKLVEGFKTKLAEEFHLPVEYFIPQKLVKSVQKSSGFPKNYELTHDLVCFYDIIETSM